MNCTLPLELQKVVSKSLGLWIIPAEIPMAAYDTVLAEWRQSLSA